MCKGRVSEESIPNWIFKGVHEQKSGLIAIIINKIFSGIYPSPSPFSLNVSLGILCKDVDRQTY